MNVEKKEQYLHRRQPLILLPLETAVEHGNWVFWCVGVAHLPSFVARLTISEVHVVYCCCIRRDTMPVLSRFATGPWSLIVHDKTC